jgi:hypothetical protein
MLILIAGWKGHSDSNPTTVYIGTDGEKARAAALDAQEKATFATGFLRRFNLNRSSGVPLPVVPDGKSETEDGQGSGAETGATGTSEQKPGGETPASTAGGPPAATADGKSAKGKSAKGK